MNLGDTDGKGKIYDEEGDLILKKGEKILGEFPTTCKTWAAPYKRGPKKAHLQGIQGIHIKGRVIVTDQRVVFLGEPFHYHQGFDAIGIMGSSYGNFQYAMQRSKMAYKRGGKMYVEYDIDKIKKVRVYPTGTAVYSLIGRWRKFKMKFDRNFGVHLRELIGDRLPD